jgi:hypothetical protein
MPDDYPVHAMHRTHPERPIDLSIGHAMHK